MTIYVNLTERELELFSIYRELVQEFSREAAVDLTAQQQKYAGEIDNKFWFYLPGLFRVNNEFKVDVAVIDLH